MRVQFLEKFEEIKEQYNIVFRELFGGGKGTLKLMEDEDVLECGIQIIAQPPGKTLKNMSMLSGGEKALSAIAILFAIVVGKIVKTADKELLIQIAGIAVVLGHTYPIFFGFKGGKGVATSLGVLLTTNWQIGLICLVFALVLMALTKMVSVGSCGAAILYPVLTLFISQHYTILTEGKNGKCYFVYSLILAIIVLYNHRSNIKRILSGTENKLSFKNTKD